MRGLRRRHGRARLARVWVVSNPSPEAELSDILFSVDPSSEMLENYIRGGLPGSWHKEGHDLYASRAQATKEARRRLAARGPRMVDAGLNEWRGR